MYTVKKEATKTCNKITSNNNQQNMNNNEYYSIINEISQTYQWTEISTKSQNMLSFKKQSQRINIWIKQNMKITIRIQPMEKVYKDITIDLLNVVLQNVENLITFSDEGQ